MGDTLPTGTKTTVDKRRATWRLKEADRDKIAECFKGQTNLLTTLQKNSKTGPKIMKCELVKREQLKAFVTDYLNFLKDWEAKKISADNGRYYEDDIAKCIELYLDGGKKVDWTTLCEEVPDAAKQSD